jgi:Flp pilus assembly pilin Flp
VDTLVTAVTTAWNAIKTAVTTVVNGIKAVVIPVWTAISTAVITVVNTIKEGITTGFNAVKTVVTTVFNAVKQAIIHPFDTAYSIVKGVVNKLRNLFNFHWSLPHLEIPHFRIDGGQAPWGLGGKGKFPSVSVDWYAKAMHAPMLLNRPTIFGAMGDNYLAGGENGAEVVSGVNPLMNMIRNATTAGNSGRDAMLQTIVSLLAEYLPDIGGGTDPDQLFAAFDQRLGEALI